LGALSRNTQRKLVGNAAHSRKKGGVAMKRMKRIPAVVSLVLFSACAAVCQIQTPTQMPGFEVASIKLSSTAGGGTQIGVSPGGMFTARNVTVRTLIQEAYDLRDFQVSGGPGWLDEQLYDIVAKGNGAAASDDEIRKMTDEQRKAFKAQFLLKLQMLLADRFQLKVHRETKELPIYALIVAKSGPKLKPVGGEPVLGGLTVRGGDAGQAVITGNSVTMAALARLLSSRVGRAVVEMTNLTGDYDFKMSFTPDMAPQPGSSGDGTDQPAGVDSGGPSIFTALQEQLGLRLEAQKGPVEVVVIDSVQKASEN
jgi:bla regulator protein blaR1